MSGVTMIPKAARAAKAARGTKRVRAGARGPRGGGAVVQRTRSRVAGETMTSSGSSRRAIQMGRDGALATTAPPRNAGSVVPTRNEKFMGNAQRVQGPPLMLKSSGNKPATRREKAIIAGVGVTAGAIGFALGEKVDNKGTSVPTTTATGAGGTVPMGPAKVLPQSAGQGARMERQERMRVTPTSTTTPQTPASKPAPKSTASSGSSKPALKGKALADYLGLSADSAVRTYMETGKHKYPTKKGGGYGAGKSRGAM